MVYNGTVVYMGTREDICILSHYDEKGKPITTEISSKSARNYLKNGMKGLLPVVVMPILGNDGYVPLGRDFFDRYFSGINQVSYSTIHPDLAAKKEKRRERSKKNRKEARKRRAKKSKPGRKARGWTGSD